MSKCRPCHQVHLGSLPGASYPPPKADDDVTNAANELPGSITEWGSVGSGFHCASGGLEGVREAQTQTLAMAPIAGQHK